jgi:hypothetical protein
MSVVSSRNIFPYFTNIKINKNNYSISLTIMAIILNIVGEIYLIFELRLKSFPVKIIHTIFRREAPTELKYKEN